MPLTTITLVEPLATAVAVDRLGHVLAGRVPATRIDASLRRGVALVFRHACEGPRRPVALGDRAGDELARMRSIGLAPAELTVVDGCGQPRWGRHSADLVALRGRIRAGEVGIVWARDHQRFGRKCSALLAISHALERADGLLIVGTAPHPSHDPIADLFACTCGLGTASSARAHRRVRAGA